MSRRFGGAGIRRGIRGGGAPRGGGVAPLYERILAAPQSSTWRSLVVAAPEAYVLDAGKLSAWVDLSPSAKNFSQGTDGARPVFGATVFNGGPGFSFSGSQYLQTASLSVGGDDSLVWFFVGSVTAGGANPIVCDWGSQVATGAGFQRISNQLVGTVKNGANRARAVASGVAMTAAGTYVLTYDDDATPKTELRLDGVDVDDGHPDDAGSAPDNLVQTLGSNPSGSNGFTGVCAAFGLLSGTALSSADVAACEALFAEGVSTGVWS